VQRFSQSDPSPHSCQRVTFSCLSRPAGVAATEYRTNSDVTIVRCTNIVPIVSCQIRMLTARNKLASAEDNGVVIHNLLALTHTFQPCRPAYPEAWRHYSVAAPGCQSWGPRYGQKFLHGARGSGELLYEFPSGVEGQSPARSGVWGTNSAKSQNILLSK